VTQIAIVIAGLAAALAIAPALAEDFTAGKSPAQLFRSDCGGCHHSPNGLVKERGDVGSLTTFLREHYTTKPETAAALAAYVSGLASPGGSARNRDAAQPGRERTRGRSDGDAPVAAAEPAAPRSADDPAAGRHRRRAASPADGNRRGTREDNDAPRPPRGIAAAARPAAASRTHAPEPSGEAREADGPASRLRSYLSSGLDSQNAGAQAAGRTGTPKIRKRRNGDAAAATRTDAPAPAPQPAPAAPEPAPAAAPATMTPESAPSGPQ
jgi:hypothetical protein